jgi:hypothetical protein
VPRPKKPAFEPEDTKPATFDDVFTDLCRWPQDELRALVDQLTAYLQKERPNVRPDDRPRDRRDQVPQPGV